MKNNKRGLTPRQEKWAAEYPIDFNATQAAIRAGYSKRSAHRSGQDNLKKPYLMKAAEKKLKTHLDNAGVTVERVLEEKQRVAFADIAEIFDGETLLPPEKIPEPVRRALSGIDVIERWEKNKDDDPTKVLTYKYRFWDKMKALELLGRYLGMYTGKGDGATVVFLGAEDIDKPDDAGQ